MHPNISLFFATLLLLPSVLAVALVPRRTPNFYVVAMCANRRYNRKFLKVHGYDASLTSGTPIKLYLDGGGLVGEGPTGNLLTGHINFEFSSTGSCSNFGSLSFISGSSTNKCGRGTGFSLLPFSADPRLGSRVVVDGGGMYVCPGGVLKFNVNDGACDFVSLWAVPE